jgi:hypothetical protein
MIISHVIAIGKGYPRRILRAGTGWNYDLFGKIPPLVIPDFL